MPVEPKVLVTDAQMRNSLAIIRSLGRQGLAVTGAEETRFATSFFSRYCARRMVYPSPYRHPHQFVDFMLDAVRRDRYEAIFPVTDATTVLIARYKEEFSRYVAVPVPDYQVLMKAMDKAEALRAAMKNGIPCPRTFFIDNAGEVEEIKGEAEFPLIIKPRLGFGSRGLVLCHSAEELAAAYPKVVAAYGPCLVQEYIPPGGEDLGVYALLNLESKLRAVTVQKRLRSYPVSGGPSTLRETVKRPELIQLALRLLGFLGWSGIAMVEFRTDPRDKQPKLMEINPRWWGSLQLSILSGVDFPHLLYRLATEGDVEPALDYRVGVKCRWLLPGDILWLLSAPASFRSLSQFLQFVPNDDIMSWRDPGPSFGFLLAGLRFAFDRDMWKFMIRKPLQVK